MARYWILDNDNTPQRFPLRRLLATVLHEAKFVGSSCELIKVRGYGTRICELEVRLDEAERIVVPLTLLEELSEGIDEWFYDLEARLPSAGVLFGLHDSTALFVEAHPDLAARVLSAFTNTRKAL